MSDLLFDTLAASYEAGRWAKKWALANGGEMLTNSEEIGESAGIFFGHVVTAYHHGHLLVVENPNERFSLPSLPDDADFILITAAVCWGFAFKHGDAIWMGYHAAGNGMPADTYVWPATARDYAAFAAFTQ